MYIAPLKANGNIHVNLELNPNHPATLATLEEVITAAINEPILQKIKSYLEQSGYNYILFQGLQENNIEIKNITYISSLLIRKKCASRTLFGMSFKYFQCSRR